MRAIVTDSRTERVQRVINSFFDIRLHPEIQVRHRRWQSFQLCGYMGLMLAALLGIMLAVYLGLSPLVITLILLAAVLTFVGLVMTTKIITGEERIVFYHHAIAVAIVTALLLWLLRQPILPYLDVTVLGVGLFLVCGRMGCLLVGCCHGRPHGWGICYREEHAVAGFTPCFVGVRLFPIQAVESLWVFCIVLVGTTLILGGHPPGTALAWYFVTYDLGRFCFEFLRGDPNRSYLWGFSEAQWISLLLMCGVVGTELAGRLPFHWWHAVATACLALAMIAISLRRRFQRPTKHQLLHPHHIKEVAEAVELVSPLAKEAAAVGRWTVMPKRDSAPASILIGCTSLGVQISASKIRGAAGWIYHYALSYQNMGMTEETARVLAQLILQLERATGSTELVKGDREVFHLFIHPLTTKGSAG